jgi:SAM-dependent methyltransferase
VGDGVDPLESAIAHADLGLPLPRRTRFRLFKRAMARTARLFTSHQVEVNRGLSESVLQQRIALGEAEQRALADTDRLTDDLAAVRNELADLHSELVGRRNDPELLRTQPAELQDTIAHLIAHIEHFRADLAATRNELDAIRQGEPTRKSVVPGTDDELYEAYEDNFRGSFEDITQRLRVYLPDIEKVGSPGRVLDIGTGRGEWLQLLADAGIDAYGIDTNAVAIERCRRRGLEVVHGDALAHLAGLPDASLAAITGFHVVEHLESFNALVELIDQAVRVLRPGGLMILETPNPDNVIVGASLFYQDPSHHRPVPPRLLEFVMSRRGFVDVELRLLHPMDASLIDDNDAFRELRPLVDRLNEVLFGAQDYAVLGRRVGP